MDTYYTVLGVAETASDTEIKSAYRKLIQEFHPDTVPNASAAWRKIADEKAKEINEAYTNLSKYRATYDAQIAAQRPKPAVAPAPKPQPTPQTQPKYCNKCGKASSVSPCAACKATRFCHVCGTRHPLWTRVLCALTKLWGRYSPREVKIRWGLWAACWILLLMVGRGASEQHPMTDDQITVVLALFFVIFLVLPLSWLKIMGRTAASKGPGTKGAVFGMFFASIAAVLLVSPQPVGIAASQATVKSQSELQSTANASCVKTQGAGWVANGVSADRPLGMGCERPLPAWNPAVGAAGLPNADRSDVETKSKQAASVIDIRGNQPLKPAEKFEYVWLSAHACADANMNRWCESNSVICPRGEDWHRLEQWHTFYNQCELNGGTK